MTVVPSPASRSLIMTHLQGYEAFSPLCNNKGTYKCGICECADDYFGHRCECDANNLKYSGDLERGCRPENTETTTVCNNRGDCICGKCSCYPRAHPDEVLLGRNFCCHSCGKKSSHLTIASQLSWVDPGVEIVRISNTSSMSAKALIAPLKDLSISKHDLRRDSLTPFFSTSIVKMTYQGVQDYRIHSIRPFATFPTPITGIPNDQRWARCWWVIFGEIWREKTQYGPCEDWKSWTFCPAGGSG